MMGAAGKEYGDGPGFYVIGIHRSGTNWLTAMLRENFPMLNISDNQKHMMPDAYAGWPAVPFLLVHKRLDHWLNSIMRYSADLCSYHPEIYNKDKSLNPHDAAILHGEFYRRWGSMLERWEYGGMRVEYGDLLRDPAGTLGEMAQRYNLEHPARWRTDVQLHPRDHMTPQKRAYYLGEGHWGVR